MPSSKKSSSRVPPKWTIDMGCVDQTSSCSFSHTYPWVQVNLGESKKVETCQKVHLPPFQSPQKGHPQGQSPIVETTAHPYPVQHEYAQNKVHDIGPHARVNSCRTFGHEKKTTQPPVLCRKLRDSPQQIWATWEKHLAPTYSETTQHMP